MHYVIIFTENILNFSFNEFKYLKILSWNGLDLNNDYKQTQSLIKKTTITYLKEMNYHNLCKITYPADIFKNQVKFSSLII